MPNLKTLLKTEKLIVKEGPSVQFLFARVPFENSLGRNNINN